MDVLWNLGPHDVSILNYLTGAIPESVSTWGIATLDPGARRADVVYGMIRYPGGIRAHVHLSWLDPLKVRRMLLVGTKKMLIYDDTNSAAPVSIHDKSAVPDGSGRFVTRSGEISPLSINLPEPLGLELAHFISCIRTGSPPLTGGVHALGVVATLEAMSESLKESGKTVPVRVPPREAAP